MSVTKNNPKFICAMHSFYGKTRTLLVPTKRERSLRTRSLVLLEKRTSTSAFVDVHQLYMKDSCQISFSYVKKSTKQLDGSKLLFYRQVIENSYRQV